MTIDREKEFKFHIKNKELFIQLAAEVDLIKQGFVKDKIGKRRIRDYLREHSKNLMWLHEHTIITLKKRQK